MPSVPNVVLLSCKPQQARAIPADGPGPTAIRNAHKVRSWLAYDDGNVFRTMSPEEASTLEALDQVLSKEIDTSPNWSDDSPDADNRRLLNDIALTNQRLAAKAARRTTQGRVRRLDSACSLERLLRRVAGS